MKKNIQNILAITGISSIVAVGGIAMAISSADGSKRYTSPSSSTHNSENTSEVIEKREPEIKVKTETSTKTIPYETKYVNDNSLPKGQTKVITAGVNGIETTTYEVTYTDGIESSRETIDIEITTQPVAEVIAQGTHVAPQPQTTTCPNGTYVNSAGNTVCRPTASSTRPAGATAQCKDGTYSYSQSRRGTCSHHGGVSIWF